MADEVFELRGKLTLDTSKARQAIKDLNTTLGKISSAKNNAGQSQSSDVLKQVSSGYKDVEASAKSASERIKEVTSSEKESTTQTKSLSQVLKNIDIKGSTKKLSVFFGQLKRIATYRLIRTALKAITQGFSEGISNIYQWSKAINGDFAKAMDNFASSTQYIKNSFATAFAPLIQSLIPLVERLANSIASATESISRFFAIINGTGYYKAIKQSKEYAQATNQLKASILGFDQLNTLNGNGSASGTDTSDMFKWIEEVANKSAFESALDKIVLHIKGIEPVIDFTEEETYAMTGAALGGAIGGLAGLFMFKSTAGMVVGTLLGARLGILFTELFPSLNPGTTASATEMTNLLVAVGGGLAGALALNKLGFKGVAGGLGGFVMGASISLLFSSISALASGNLDVNKGEFWNVLGDLLLGASGVLGAKMMLTGDVLGGLAVITLGAILKLSFKSVGAKIDKNAKTTIEDSYALAMEMDSMVDENAYAKVVESIKRNTSATQRRGVSVLDNLIPRYAVGGVPEVGSLFWAGENGAELVASVGGRTTVYNEEQLVGELSVANEGVINAILSIGNAIVNAVDRKPVPRIGDRDLYRSAQRGAGLVGGSLVGGA